MPVDAPVISAVFWCAFAPLIAIGLYPFRLLLGYSFSFMECRASPLLYYDHNFILQS